MKKKQKLKNNIIIFLKDNYKFLLLSFVLIIIGLLTFKSEKRTDAFSILEEYKLLIYSIILLLGVILSFAFYKIKRENIKIETLFLMLVIPIGIMYMLLIPIGRVPDEAHHFYRAYEVSKGHLISEKYNDKMGGNYFSEKFKDVFVERNNYQKELDNITLKKDNTEIFYAFSNTSLYSFVNYIPQAVGIKIGDILNLPIIFIAMLGRLTNFAIWALLMYYAIKKMPFKKISVLFTMFMPIVLQEAASLSADALTLGTSFFFISYILELRYNKEKKYELKDKVILAIAAIVLSLCKIVYLPLCLLMFLIPYGKFMNKKSKYIEIGLLAFIVVSLNLIWLKISSQFLVEFNVGVNSTEQIIYVLKNPILFIVTVFATVYKYFSYYLNSMVGGSLCYLDVALSDLFTYSIIFIIIFVILLDSSSIKKYDKWYFCAIALMVFLLIFTSLYVQWTPVGYENVMGVQGRYLIPLFIPLFILCNTDKIRYDIEKYYKNIFMVMIFINIYALITIFCAHMM